MCIAIFYKIESDKQPFHHLNSQFSSVEIEKTRIMILCRYL
jgi:hypothetical protein